MGSVVEVGAVEGVVGRSVLGEGVVLSIGAFSKTVISIFDTPQASSSRIPDKSVEKLTSNGSFTKWRATRLLKFLKHVKPENDETKVSLCHVVM